MCKLHRHDLAEARLAFEIFDAKVVVDAGQRRGRVDRIVEIAKLVDEAELLGLFAQPDAPAGDLVDAFDRHLARLGDLADEALVTVLYAQLQNRACLVPERTIGAEVSGQRRSPNAIHMNAELVERALGRREIRADADRAGNAGRARPDLGRWHRDPVAAGRGDAAHRGDERFARLTQQLELATDDLGGERASAAGIHAQYDRFHVLVVARLAHERRGRVAA